MAEMVSNVKSQEERDTNEMKEVSVCFVKCLPLVELERILNPQSSSNDGRSMFSELATWRGHYHYRHYRHCN